MTNQTIDERSKVVEWAGEMARKGMLDRGTANAQISALKVLTSVLTDDEPKDVNSLINGVNDMASRWATKEHANPVTTRTYASRVRRLLEDFISYRSDPTNFKPKKKSTSKKSIPENLSVNSSNPPNAKPKSKKSEKSIPAFSEMKSLSLGEAGAEFQFRLPQDGLKCRDVFKITWHLLTIATDFDPMNPPRFEISLPNHNQTK